MALRSDGAVLAWGDTTYNTYTQCNVPVLPSGLAFVAVAAGAYEAVARYGVPASAVGVGTGCGGAGMPVLTATVPRIGQIFDLTVSNATPNAAGFVYISDVPASPLNLGSGCVVQVDLLSAMPLVPLSTGPTGSWMWTYQVPVPYIPVLVGYPAMLQGALFGTSGPLGFDITSGVMLSLGY